LLENRYRYHVFGFPSRLITDVEHFQSYSVGRARFRYDDDRQVVGDVVAAEKLATGCITLRPTDIAKNYRHSRRTMVVESLKANYLWGYLVDDAATKPRIEHALETTAGSCQWYDARKTSLEDYAAVAPPTHWRSGWTGGNIQRNPSADELLDDGPESDGELGEERGLHDGSLVIEISGYEKDEELDQGAAIGTGKGRRDDHMQV
jgi:hypothetical protein